MISFRTHASRTNVAGFTLVEVMVTVVILGMTFVAFEQGIAVLIRAMSDSTRETLATQLSTNQAERLAATACRTATGTDSVNGVVATWSITPTGPYAHLMQTTEFASATGLRRTTHTRTIPCR